MVDSRGPAGHWTAGPGTIGMSLLSKLASAFGLTAGVTPIASDQPITYQEFALKFDIGPGRRGRI